MWHDTCCHHLLNWWTDRCVRHSQVSENKLGLSGSYRPRTTPQRLVSNRCLLPRWPVPSSTRASYKQPLLAHVIVDEDQENTTFHHDSYLCPCSRSDACQNPSGFELQVAANDVLQEHDKAQQRHLLQSPPELADGASVVRAASSRTSHHVNKKVPIP